MSSFSTPSVSACASAATEKPECSVCAAKYTPCLRVPFKCRKCNFECCVPCIKQYLVTLASEEYGCMSCRVSWDLDFIQDNLGHAFYVGNLRKHRMDCLRVRERALLGDNTTQSAVKKLRQANEASELAKSQLQREKELKRQRIQLDLEIDECQTIKTQALRVVRAYKENQETDEPEINPTKQALPVHCAFPECRGFLVDNLNECNVCGKSTCRRCLDLIDGSQAAAHVCDKSVLEMNRAIRKESKPCPKCGERISKTDGCDQMFCIICKTAFSWNTGRVGNGKNPQSPLL